VADVPGQAEKVPPAADVIDEAEKAKQEADQPVSAPPAMTYDEEIAEIMKRPMPEGNRRRALNEARNREMTRQFDAQIRGRQAGLH
jgi:hypothetical protein